MGHKDIETTMKYVHVGIGLDGRLMSPIDRLILKTDSTPSS